MPVEQAVSLLAIHCIARQQTPGDFGVMVEAGKPYFRGSGQTSSAARADSVRAFLFLPSECGMCRP